MKQDSKPHHNDKISTLVTIFGAAIIIFLTILTIWKSGFGKNKSENKLNNQDSLKKRTPTQSLPTISEPKEFPLVVYFNRSSDQKNLLTLYGTILESPTPLHWLDNRTRLGDHFRDDSQVISTVVFKNNEETFIDTTNLLIPIDLIWTNTIGGKDVIVDIAENIQPKTAKIYKPAKEANHVLAIPSGFTKKYSIKIGDFVNYSD